MNCIVAALQALWLPALGRTLQERALRYFFGHHSLCAYHLSNWHHHTRPDLPGLPSLYFVYCKQSKGGGNGPGMGLPHAQAMCVILLSLTLLTAGLVQSAQLAGPKIAWWFPCLSVCLCVHVYRMIMCTIIMSHTLVPCNLTLVNLTAALSTGVDKSCTFKSARYLGV